MLHHQSVSRMLQKTSDSGVEQHQQRCDPGSGVEQQKKRWDPESGVEQKQQRWDPESGVEQKQQRWDPENGVSGTASPEVGSGEWSEWNSSNRGGTQRVE